ncbi:MAG: hypothetical protein L0Z62_12365 [Gemmataceae bacterium]|nr:hypothetical protein [Gemmataceae bacterium]
MLWWVVDNANLMFLLLGLIVLVLAVRFWLTRRGAYLIGAGAAVALVGLVLALSLLIVTDRKRLVLLVDEVTDKLNRKDFKGAFSHMADEVQFEMSNQKKKVSRKLLQWAAERDFQKHRIQSITVSNVGVDNVERPTAVVSFNIQPTGERSGLALCTAECVLVGEDWLVKGLKIELPANWQVPFPELPAGGLP